MTPERWKRVREVFDALAEAPPGDRERLLAEACGTDAALAAEVRSLLASVEAAGDFLEAPAHEQMRWERGDVGAPAPERIGPWQVLRELGEGGMGTVYLAERSDSGFRQTSAVKLVRRGMDSDFILRRFHTEREILAGLDHPHIARLLDGGSTDAGIPYFAMEYVDGRHLLEDCAARGLDARRRTQLFLEVCDAVAYAHRHLVVHRDLKPSNILVTPEGSPKLLDFGLARLLPPDGAFAGDRTETAFRLLTPDYASPEQIRGERVTTSTDIYSLGVVLYRLLSGRSPYRSTGESGPAIARAVCEEKPERPGVSRDLDNIVLMALRKEPERRYASVEALADDLKRFLDGHPVRARKDTLAYRTVRFVARHKAGTAAAALGTLVLAAATAVALQQARVARAERSAAESRFDDVRKLASSFLFEFHDAIRDLPGSTPARELVVRRALEYLRKLSDLKAGDAALQRDVATAYERVARVQGGIYGPRLGDTRGARDSLDRALAIRTALARMAPADASDQAALAEARLQNSELLLAEGEPAAALEQVRASVGILAALAAASPGDRAREAKLARGRRYEGVALAQGGDREGGLRVLASAAATFESLAAAEPGNAAYRRELAITHSITVHALGGSSDRERASASYARATGLQEALVASEPGNASLKRELAYTHADMGAFYEWSGDESAALSCYARAVPMVEALVASDPRNADARLLLAETYNSIGYGLAVTGDLAGAPTNLDRSLRLFEAIVREDPADARAQVGLARLYESYGTAAEASARGGLAEQRERARAWYAKSREAYAALAARGLLDRRTRGELDAVTKKLAALGPG